MPFAPAPPPCKGLGSQCHELRVTLRVSSEIRHVTRTDHEATWLLGHTQRISFGKLWAHEGDLFVRATIHVPCKHLEQDDGRSHCRAHGFTGRLPDPGMVSRQPRRLGGDRFRLVEHARLADLSLPAPAPRRRSLAVLNDNPCATAPCRTADHTRGAACCRDLQVEIMCDEADRRRELLIRSRKPPYLCKVTRESEESIEAEIISACDYLGEDGISCTLHGRLRPDGRQAKPDLCRRWPKPTLEETLHPGCVFAVPPAGAGV